MIKGTELQTLLHASLDNERKSFTISALSRKTINKNHVNVHPLKIQEVCCTGVYIHQGEANKIYIEHTLSARSLNGSAHKSRTLHGSGFDVFTTNDTLLEKIKEKLIKSGKIQIDILLHLDIRHPDFHPLSQKSRSQNMYLKTILTLGTVAAVSYLDRVASCNVPDIRETVPINIALIGKEADFYTPLGREAAKHLPPGFVADELSREILYSYTKLKIESMESFRTDTSTKDKTACSIQQERNVFGVARMSRIESGKPPPER